MKPSKEQKAELIAALSHAYGKVVLVCDDYRITLKIQRTKSLSYRVVTYVNGIWKGEWVNGQESHPEQKFLNKQIRTMCKPSEKARAIKQFGKRWVSKQPYYNEKITLYYIDWASGRAAINHLFKVCENIEIVEG